MKRRSINQEYVVRIFFIILHPRNSSRGLVVYAINYRKTVVATAYLPQDLSLKTCFGGQLKKYMCYFFCSNSPLELDLSTILIVIEDLNFPCF
jgi:hypothetical protein